MTLRLLSTIALLTSTALAWADGLLHANTATAEQLEATAELSPAAVSAILAARPFATPGELDAALAGVLSDDERETAYARVFVPIALNSATREDILLIPGVGRRMAHEFEEYRPYTSMEQFRREIGKYVDDDEVARLEMYVSLGE